METGTVLGVGALLVSAATAVNSYLNSRTAARSATHGELQALNDTYREEIERLKVEGKESKAECLRQIAEIQVELKSARTTIIEQAGQIATLQRVTRQGGQANG